jgi:hypothetical protein
LIFSQKGRLPKPPFPFTSQGFAGNSRKFFAVRDNGTPNLLDYKHSEPAAPAASRKSTVLLPEFVAAKFGVSKRAALIRLERLNAIVGKTAQLVK